MLFSLSPGYSLSLLFILIVCLFYWLLCFYPLNTDWCSMRFLTPLTGYSHSFPYSAATATTAATINFR